MSALPKAMTLDEFVAWEERQELRYEYDGFDARAMTGGTASHAGLHAGLMRELGMRLLGQPCRVFGSDLKVRTGTSVRYPDAVITCTRPAPHATITPDPVVIFEILSKSTARIDLGVKNMEYQSIPSLKAYVLLAQDATHAQIFRRDEEGEFLYETVSAGGTLRLPEVGVCLPLAEIYRDVDLTSQA